MILLITDSDYMRNPLIHRAAKFTPEPGSIRKEALKGERMTPEQVKKRLEDTYPNSYVDVTDLTGTHDHYSVYIASSTFNDMSRIQRHKHVMAAFDAELKTGEVHALTIKADDKK